MHAGVGPTAGNALGPLSGDSLQGRFQLVLNRPLARLPLPTGEIGPVVSQSQSECRHLDTGGATFHKSDVTLGPHPLRVPHATYSRPRADARGCSYACRFSALAWRCAG